MPIPADAAERFWTHVAIAGENECWLWTAYCTPNGYGQVAINRYPHKAHRVAWEITNGPIPDGLTIDHVRARGCMSRACVNPAHLEPVTSRTNTLRGDSPAATNARKSQCPQGHALTADNVYSHPRAGGRRCRTCRAVQRQRRREVHSAHSR